MGNLSLGIRKPDNLKSRFYILASNKEPHWIRDFLKIKDINFSHSSTTLEGTLSLLKIDCKTKDAQVVGDMLKSYGYQHKRIDYSVS